MIDLDKPMHAKGTYGEGEAYPLRIRIQNFRSKHKQELMPVVSIDFGDYEALYLLDKNGHLLNLNGETTAFRVENVPPPPRKRTAFIPCYQAGGDCYIWSERICQTENEAERVGRKCGEDYLGVMPIELDESKLIRRPTP